MSLLIQLLLPLRQCRGNEVWQCRGDEVDSSGRSVTTVLLCCLQRLLSTFAEGLYTEMDFRNEALNMNRMKELLAQR